jgi:hypothetical protein
MSTAKISFIDMEVRKFTTQCQYCLIALILMSACCLRALAQDRHSHNITSQPHELTPDQQSKQSALLKKVREVTARFKDVKVAEAEGYALTFGCVSGSEEGAMGLHYINFDLVKGGVIDATHPQAIIYEPTSNGGVKLTGADYLVLADTWNKNHSSPPELMGQLFHLFDAPNRFGLPAFYTLHVWAWKENPNGAFVNWHPNVSCESFVPSNLQGELQ